jgi:hypothetical protein
MPRQWRAQQKAKQDALAAQYAEELERKRAAAVVTRNHTAKLTEANTRAMTYQDRAEHAERKADGLERQITGLLKGQRT